MRLCTLLLAGLLAACATHKPDYRLDTPTAPQRSQAQAIRVAIGPFEDIRNATDVLPTALTWCSFAQIELEKGALEETMARHLQHDGVFSLVEVADPSARLPQLKASGFDALLVGKLKHYQGSYCGPEYSILDSLPVLSILFFPVSIVYVLTLEPREHKGITELVDITLLDTRTAGVLWSGQAYGTAFQSYGGLGRARVADESLKQAISSLGDQLKLRALVTRP